MHPLMLTPVKITDTRTSESVLQTVLTCYKYGYECNYTPVAGSMVMNVIIHLLQAVRIIEDLDNRFE